MTVVKGVTSNKTKKNPQGNHPTFPPKPEKKRNQNKISDSKKKLGRQPSASEKKKTASN